jgi:mannan endo-1,4-beta-mannosidase
MNNLIVKHVLLVFFMCVALFVTAQETESFYTKNGKLYDVNNNEFIVRGVNNPHIWLMKEAYEALETIAALKFNSVRVVWGLNGSANDLRRIFERIVELEMVVIPEIHDPTGKNDIVALEEAARYWARDDVKVVLNDFKPYVILNIANEWMASGDAENWYNGYLSAISIVRNAGLNHCLLIDAAGWGQNLDPTKKYATNLIEHDPEKNLMFSVHMYGSWNNNTKIEDEIIYFRENKLALLVGEFGYDYKNGDNNLGCKVDAPFLLQKCDEYGIGYMPWSWTGNNEENQWLDMVDNADWRAPTEWGALLMSSKHGISNTSKTCSVFVQGLPEK